MVTRAGPCWAKQARTGPVRGALCSWRPMLKGSARVPWGKEAAGTQSMAG